MHKPGARIEAEAEEPDLPRRKLEDNGIVVRHGDIEGGSVKMLRPGRASHGAVVREAAIGRANDQRLAKPVAQRLQLVERGLVDQQLSGALAGDFGRREVRPALGTLGDIAPVVVEGRGHGILQKRKTRLEGG